mgnify:FL=1
MKNTEHITDLCVVGGGMAGVCAAVSAARHGIKVVLVQDRGVLGGNASSEIRMWICGAHGKDNRETGIIEEIMLENFYSNPQLSYPLWDAVLYNKVRAEKNLTILLNCSCLDAECEDGRIVSIKAWQSPCETMHTVKAKFFADCSGDSILAPLSGADFRYGREARSEFNEKIEPETADKKTMGMSCLFQVRETDRPQKFTPPEWAYKYPTDADIPFREHDLSTNFWWIELGGEGDCIHDTDKYRDELLKIAYGVWDHVKNHGDHGAENYQLEWVGLLPGKRESRRYVGKYTVNQNDVEAGGKFSDVIAYGGWSMDDHFPAGMNHKTSYPTIYHPAPSPWGIPFRALCSKNIKNLLFAGRNISVTHAALSSSRVMATCGLLGQAVGTAVAQMINDGENTDNIDIEKLQNTLMADDCFLPGKSRRVSELSKSLICSSEIVRNGKERCDENKWVGKKGDYLEYKSEKPFKLSSIRIVFDSDLNRDYHNMPCCIKLNEERFKLPKTLIKDFDITLTDACGVENVIPFRNNHNRLFTYPVSGEYTSVKLTPVGTFGAESFSVFDFEVL